VGAERHPAHLLFFTKRLLTTWLMADSTKLIAILSP
jgi:hypothetical protein